MPAASRRAFEMNLTSHPRALRKAKRMAAAGQLVDAQSVQAVTSLAIGSPGLAPPGLRPRLSTPHEPSMKAKHPIGLGISLGVAVEMMLDNYSVAEANWRDATAVSPHFVISESPRFVGDRKSTRLNSSH